MDLAGDGPEFRHAPPVRCPKCCRPALALWFDSATNGMVCGQCHQALIELRKDKVALLIKRRTDDRGQSQPHGTHH